MVGARVRELFRSGVLNAQFQEWFRKQCDRLTKHEVDSDEHPSHWTNQSRVRVFLRKRDYQECPPTANLSTDQIIVPLLTYQA